MSSKPLRKYPGIFSALLTVLLAVAWAFFAPRMLGGQAGYVIVNGDSMEPLYHRGDLVILLQADQAEVGDIFAYRYPELGPVIHRVVAKEGNRFIMKGDHNPWTDGYQPVFGDFIGKAAFHLTGVGNTVRWLRQPARFAGLVAIMAGLLVFGMAFDSSQKKNMKIKWPHLRLSFPRIPPSISREREGYLFALSLLLFASIALGVYAFIRPISRLVEDNIEYINTVEYVYTAPSNPQVYTDGVIQPGEPVFTQLNCKLRIIMDYAIKSTQPVDVSGTYNAIVIVSEPTGWKKTIPLLPDTPFTNNAFQKSILLDVCEIQKTIEKTNELTGLNRPYYSVSVITAITADGTIGNRAYHEVLSPKLDFSLDATELYLVQGDADDSDPLLWNQDGMILGASKMPNDLSIFGLEIPVLAARVTALVGLVIAITGILLLTLPAYQDAKRDELASIHLKYAPLLVQINPAQSKRRAASAKLVEIASMADLARLAHNTGQMVFEQTVGDEHHFLVFSDPYTYRYILRMQPKEELFPEPEEKDVVASSDSTEVISDGDKGD
jgi:signal peptidase I